MFRFYFLIHWFRSFAFYIKEHLVISKVIWGKGGICFIADNNDVNSDHIAVSFIQIRCFLVFYQSLEGVIRATEVTKGTKTLSAALLIEPPCRVKRDRTP